LSLDVGAIWTILESLEGATTLASHARFGRGTSSTAGVTRATSRR
jgi:hypothetical protein